MEVSNSRQSFYDSHVHTDCSYDGTSPVEQLCEAALQKGLAGIAITDHWEAGRGQADAFLPAITQSLALARQMQQKYAGRLAVSCGIELGQPLDDPEETRAALALGPYDVVVLSTHNLPGQADFWVMDMAGRDLLRLATEYFERELLAVRTQDFDILAHLTYPLRYTPGAQRLEEACMPVIRRVLEALIARGKALEINTKHLYGHLDGEDIPPLPSLAILGAYRELGGTLVTLGSDSHHLETVGAGLERMTALLRDLGFPHYGFYAKRNYIEIPIR